MAHLLLRPATEVSRAVLAAVLSDAFADYDAPAAFSVATLDAMIERDDILLDRSLVAYAVDAPGEGTPPALPAGRPVGAALVAVRPWRGGTRARLAGLGVVPAARRLGVGQALVGRIIADARAPAAQPRCRQIVLEVIAGNTAARRLYNAHGFVVRRRLLGFTLRSTSLRSHAPRSRRAEGVTLWPIAVPDALPLFAFCTAEEPPEAQPVWQAEAPSLARLGDRATVYAIGTPEAPWPVGYLALGLGRPVAALLHLGIVPAWRRRGLATGALAAALARHEDITALSVAPLVPECSTLVPFLASRGAARASLEQLEMALDLS